MRLDPRVYFRGFWSQGDGACYEGDYFYAKGAAQNIRAHAPHDRELHAIADALQAVQRRNFYQLSATFRHSGHSYHAYSMVIDVTRDGPSGGDASRDAEKTVPGALRDPARWLYRRLEAEYEHLTSDDTVEDGITANQYSFTATGQRFG